MTTLPGHWVRTVEHHEWTLGNRGEPMDAKTFRLGYEAILHEMDDLIELARDDAFRVEGQEDGTIKFWFEWDLGKSGYTPDPKPSDAGGES